MFADPQAQGFSQTVHASKKHYRRQLRGLVHIPVLLRREANARAVGAATLDPRNVDDDAHAVETNCETDGPDAAIFSISAAMSCASTNA